MRAQISARTSSPTSDKHLFAHDLTPQRKFLLTQTRDRIFRRTLRTSDLQLSFLHFREAKLGGWLSESVNPFFVRAIRA
jgi:hypothetical protein